MFGWLASRLFAPVDIAALVVFRVLFGGIMLWEVYRYFDFDRISNYYIKPTFYFTYYGFSWVRPWPGNGMYIHFAILGLLAFCIAIGLFYRVSAFLFFLGFTYVFLLDQANYLNHFYFVSLVSFLMIFVPAHRSFSVDAWLRPSLKTQFVPAWGRFLLQAQMAIVYIGGGVAKINGDFLRGEPMRMWLAERSDYTLWGWEVGRLFTQEWAAWFFSFGGLVFDLVVVPALLWRRTRIIAFAAVVFFHCMNAYLFNIGIFPWISLGATVTLFLPADWPSRLFLRKSPSAGVELAPVVHPQGNRRAIVAFVCIYLAIQILFPLRNWLYPSTVHWSEEGHRFSWRMKLRDKDATGAIWAIDTVDSQILRINPEDYLTRRQELKMMKTPDMILQFAHHVASEARKRNREVEVRADIKVSLNGRPFQQYIAPTVNLAAEPRSLRHAKWILPLETPLNRPGD